MPGLVAQAHLALVIGKLPREVRSKPRIGLSEVVRLGQAPPGLEGDRRQLVEAVADHLGPARIDADRPGLDLPLPGASTGADDDILQPLPLAVQRLLGGLPRQLGGAALTDIDIDDDHAVVGVR